MLGKARKKKFLLSILEGPDAFYLAGNSLPTFRPGILKTGCYGILGCHEILLKVLWGAAQSLHC